MDKATMRMLSEILTRNQPVFNINSSGGATTVGGPQNHEERKSISDQLLGGDPKDDPFEYIVDITKNDIIGPNGKSRGWTKKVHRHKDLKAPPLGRNGRMLKNFTEE